MALPSPGPGRPHHPSYSEPGPLITPREFVAIVLLAALIVGVLGLLEVVA